MMNTFERYQRQMILPDFGREKQERLQQARILMIGAGGLSCPAMLYLAAAGVGYIGIVDFDRVELSNLHRQVLYTEGDIGRSKAEVAAEKLRAYNPEVEVQAYTTRLSTENALELMRGYTVVADGSDNFPTRYLVNDACVLLDIPLIYASIFRFEGQVAVFNYSGSENKQPKFTYRDLFPEPPRPEEVPNCSEAGVLGVLPGIIGSLQANEAIKLITGIGETLHNRLLTFNALNNSFYELELQPNPESAVTAPKTEEELKQMDYGSFCGMPEVEVEEIVPEDFERLLQESATLAIDVRRPEEQPKLKNPKVCRIPLQELNRRMEELQEAEQLLFICQSGIRSKKAVELVRKIYPQKKLWSLKGGVNALAASEITEQEKQSS
ncbi:HesA/MoeB/ThiF family protein [Nafulsella turpanensis]|uniref:HesA/MoeB/ThiF family protein n=1 Tax=Nafulsella turpanensis TaxID=1265690 RepID=UPI0004780988|nr:HesA/MoeB/ThiF family protein [Nafulsella turpanensis]